MRYAPAFVSMIGILGLALGLTYLVAIGLAFTPGHDELTHFLIGESDLEFSYNFLLVCVPYAFLIAHLYLRTQLGLWMLDRGMVAEARSYVQNKQKTGLMRSKREAAHHQLAMARVFACESDYDAAWEKLGEANRRGRVPRVLRASWAHWTLEVALRRQDAVGFSAASEQLDFALNSTTGAAIWACRAEQHARARRYAKFREAVESSEYVFSSHPRLAHARSVAALRMPDKISDVESILAALRRAREQLGKTHPFLDPESEALSIYLEEQLDASDLGAEAREELATCMDRADSRGAYVIRSVLDELEAHEEEH